MKKEKNIRERLKCAFWNHVPFEVEIFLRIIFDHDFRKLHKLRRKRLQEIIIEKKISSKSNQKIRVVFLCSMPSVWNSVRSLFSALNNDPLFEIYLLAVPASLAGQWDDEERKDQKNAAYEYCQSFFKDTINAYRTEDGRWYDLKNLHPDYIVVSRPYDIEVPAPYRSEVLSQIAKLCYVPYSYCKMNWDCRQVYRCDFMDNVYATFVENKLYEDKLRRIYRKDISGGWKKIQNFGYPRFDLYQHDKTNRFSTSKTVLWLPRWTTNPLLEPSKFFEYKDKLISYFEKHANYQLICRPHPLMFSNFISTGEMSQEEVDGFHRLFEEIENFYLDESIDYLPALEESDIIIADITSLLAEIIATGKPILFCGTNAHFDRSAKQWTKQMCMVSCWEEMRNSLETLLCERKYKGTEKKSACAENTGKKITEWIKHDMGF